MSLFQQRFEDRVRAAEARAFGVTVAFSRGSLVSDTYTATWENHEYEVLDEEGFATKVQMRDYMFAVSDPVIGGQVLEPRAGDRILDDSTGETYEILPAGQLPASEKMAGGYRWKVHTKRVR